MVDCNDDDDDDDDADVLCFSIGDFKKLVAARIGRQPHEIMLKRQGERPFKDVLSLEDYSISNGVQIDLYVVEVEVFYLLFLRGFANVFIGSWIPVIDLAGFDHAFSLYGSFSFFLSSDFCYFLVLSIASFFILDFQRRHTPQCVWETSEAVTTSFELTSSTWKEKEVEMYDSRRERNTCGKAIETTDEDKKQQ